jgi:hypothetical protein
MRLFEDITREMEAFVKKFGAVIKISIIFEDFFREIVDFSSIARLFKYIFKWNEGLIKVMRGYFGNVSWALIKHISAEAFWPQSAPVLKILFNENEVF